MYSMVHISPFPGFDYPFVPVVLMQMMGVDKLARSMGIYNMMSLAPLLLIIGPLSGSVQELSKSRNVQFRGEP